MGTTVNVSHTNYQHWNEVIKQQKIPGHPTLVISEQRQSLYGEKYSFALSSSDKNLNNYQNRRIEVDNLVQVYHYEIIGQVSQCMDLFNNYIVITERIPIRLCDLHDLSPQEGFYILQQTIKGSNLLVSNFNNYFFINSSMIGFNSEGQVKIWLNQVWALNIPSRLSKRLDFMVEEIVFVIEEYVRKKCIDGFGYSFNQIYKNTNKNFYDIQQLLNRFSQNIQWGKKVFQDRIKIILYGKNAIKTKQPAFIKEKIFFSYSQTPKEFRSNNNSFLLQKLILPVKNHTNHNTVNSTFISNNFKTDRQQIFRSPVQQHKIHESLDKLKKQQRAKIGKMSFFQNNKKIIRQPQERQVIFNKAQTKYIDDTYHVQRQCQKRALNSSFQQLSSQWNYSKANKKVIPQKLSFFKSKDQKLNKTMVQVSQWNKIKSKNSNSHSHSNFIKPLSEATSPIITQSPNLSKNQYSLQNLARQSTKVQFNNVSTQALTNTPINSTPHNYKCYYEQQSPTSDKKEDVAQKETELFKYYLQSYDTDNEEKQTILNKKDKYEEKVEVLKYNHSDLFRNELDVIQQSSQIDY